MTQPHLPAKIFCADLYESTRNGQTSTSEEPLILVVELPAFQLLLKT
jgi:hypothetical protein